MRLKISVIIPVFNDDQALQALIRHLEKAHYREDFEIIVVDGGGRSTPPQGSWSGIRWVSSPKANRAIQLNMGARLANFDVLYFVHADTLPPHSFVQDINQAIKLGNLVGGYRLKLISGPLLLCINSFMTRYLTLFSGGGDQSLFITRDLFIAEQGYDEKYSIMEDFELVRRLRPRMGYHIIPKNIEASSRKYARNSYFKVNLANLKAFWLFHKGVDPGVIRQKYHAWLRNVTGD